jgi:F-type H+-transporting ATPase subunit alpha
LFNANVRPAINVGLSVSRVGGSAQTKAMKSVAGTLRLELAQYRELAAFAQFGSDLDKSSQAQLARGKRWVEVLKQGPYSPVPVEKQVAIIFAVGQGLADDIPVESMRRFETELYSYLDNSKPAILQTIREKRELKDDTKEQLKGAITEFKKQFNPGQKPEGSAGTNARDGKPAGGKNTQGQSGPTPGPDGASNGAKATPSSTQAERVKSNV